MASLSRGQQFESILTTPDMEACLRLSCNAIERVSLIGRRDGDNIGYHRLCQILSPVPEIIIVFVQMRAIESGG